LIDDICATTFLLKLLFLGEEEEEDVVAPVEPLEALVALLPLLIIVVVAEKRFSLSFASSQTVQKQQMRKSSQEQRSRHTRKNRAEFLRVLNKKKTP